MVRDITEILDPDLQLPIQGKTYRVPPATIETGIYVQQIIETAAGLAAGEDLDPQVVARLKLDDAEEQDFYRRLLSEPVVEEMRADRVPWPYLAHAARTAMIWCAQGRPAAEAYWEAGGRPEAPRPTPQAPAKKQKRKKSGRPGSAAGKTHQSPPPAA